MIILEAMLKAPRYIRAGHDVCEVCGWKRKRGEDWFSCLEEYHSRPGGSGICPRCIEPDGCCKACHGGAGYAR